MKAKFIYESIGDVLKPKSWNDIRSNIESKGETEFDYWMNVVLEFNNLFEGKLQGSVGDWKFDEEKQYRAVTLNSFIGRIIFVVDWHISKKVPNIWIDIGSTRYSLGAVAIPENPRDLAVEALEKIREKNKDRPQPIPRPAHSFKRRH